MTEIYIGSAGWSYDDWSGIVYPDPAPKGFDPLAYLAQFVDCIEVNSSFYRPPTPAMSESWARRTPDRFVFTAKVWERLTHDRDPFTDADVRLYAEGLSPLLAAGKLGALLFQFPWFFKDEPSARDRIRRGVDALRGWAPLVIELRHSSWLQALDFLRGLELNFCNIDQPESSTSITGTRIVTGPVAYIRFHGRNAKAWFSRGADRDGKYDYLYSREELRAWEEAIREMEAEKLFVILNNHFQGKGMANAFMLMRALGKELAPPPDTLRAAYPGVLP
ncbi:MAG TPA: DUF72 domain-containing protein [Planctomycetota bacterium]|nr:DUF72 domain-containing protein [Planctomycetota bacterium]